MFVQTLVRRYPHIQFMINADPKLCGAFLGEKNLKMPSKLIVFVQRCLNKLRLLSVDRYCRIAAQPYDAVIRIGGSIFMENPAFACDLSSFHRNEFVVGANFGPYVTETYLNQVETNLTHCTDVCFRDRYSLNMFKHLKQIRYAPEILFGYRYYPERNKGYGVGISVIAAHERSALERVGQQYYDTIAAVCDLLSMQDIPVKLFSFCKQEGDMRAVGRVLEKVNHRENVTVCQYEGNVDRILEEMNSCEYMIATRYHAMILAWAMGKKVLPVIYSRKQTHVLDDMHYDGYVWDLLTGEQPSPSEVIKQCLCSKNMLDVNQLAVDSQRHFDGVDCFFRAK